MIFRHMPGPRIGLFGNNYSPYCYVFGMEEIISTLFCGECYSDISDNLATFSYFVSNTIDCSFGRLNLEW